jgi:hypothetical protein
MEEVLKVKTRDYNSIQWSDYFVYDTSSPTCLRWKNDRYAGLNNQIKRKSAGDIAGSLREDKSDGYKSQNVSLKNKSYRVSRIIYCLFYGSISEDMVIDHINGNSTDNRIENLRLVPISSNNRNAKLRKDNPSGIAGVRIVDHNGNTYANARWTDENGKLRGRWFNVKKFGVEKAMEMAVQYRNEMISKLNSIGADYSARHGASGASS